VLHVGALGSSSSHTQLRPFRTWRAILRPAASPRRFFLGRICCHATDQQ
jgi:hypothetical protein